MHPSQVVEFFDPVLHTPVCVHCKMVGSHSSGEAAMHRLVGIDAAYRDALECSAKRDAVLEARQSAVREHLAHLSSRLHEVLLNGARVQRELEEAMRRALAQLRTQTAEKVRTLLAEELQLRRQEAEVCPQVGRAERGRPHPVGGRWCARRSS